MSAEGTGADGSRRPVGTIVASAVVAVGFVARVWNWEWPCGSCGSKFRRVHVD